MNARQFIALILAFLYIVTLASAAPSRVLMRFGKRAVAGSRFDFHELPVASYGFLPYGAVNPQYEGFDESSVDQ